MSSVAAIVTAALAVALAVPLAAEPAGYPVRIGDRVVVTIRAELAGTPAQERAARATYAVDLALRDPACGPEGIAVTGGEDTLTIDACGRRVLGVGADDGVWEGRDAAATAAAWTEALRSAFDAEKQAVYSGVLLRRALLGLLYPLVLVGVFALLRWLSRRLQASLLVPRPGRHGLRLGPANLLDTEAERVFLARIVGLLRWALSLGFAYVLLAAMFRQLPGTRDWAAAMVRPLAELAASVAEGLVVLLPRLLVLVAVVVVLRLALRAVTRLFDQVRRGEAAFGPLVSPENATPVEKTVKIVLSAAALVLAALILPGLGGQTLAAALLLAGLAVALGAQHGAADFMAGLVVVYGRPFRTGQVIRVAGHEGTVIRKGLLHTVIAARDGSPVLLPNRVVLSEVVTVVAPRPALQGSIVIEHPGAVAAALDLVRAALAEAGLDERTVRVRLVAVRAGRAVIAIDEDGAAGAPGDAGRDRFLAALVRRAAAEGARVVAALDPEGASS